MVGRIALDTFQFDPGEPNIPRLLREQTEYGNPDIPYFAYAFETDFDTLLGLLKGLLDIDEHIPNVYNEIVDLSRNHCGPLYRMKDKKHMILDMYWDSVREEKLKM